MPAPATVSQEFVVLPPHLSLREAVALLEGLGPAYVVVAAEKEGAAYLVCTALEVERMLGAAGGDARLGPAAEAAGIEPAPAVETGDREPDADRWVVLEDGLLAGVCVLSTGFGSPRRAGILRGDPAGGHAMESAVHGGSDSGEATRFCASFPEQVRLGETASLLAWLGDDEGSSASAPIELDMARPVNVLVEPGAGFVVEGRDEGELDPAGDAMDTLRFRLRAVAEGPARVRVFAFQDGRSRAVLTLRARVGAGAGSGARVEAVAALEAPAAAGGAPDVSVLVMERREDGRPVLELLVHAHDPELGLFQRRFGPVALALEPLAFFSDFFREIEEAGERGAAHPRETALALEAKGAWLFETLVPPALREVLWRLRHRIRTIQVCSDEPWIPWELCRLTGEEEGEVREDDFLCARFQVTRWMAGVPLRPRLTLRNLALVAPRDSDLSAVAAERAYFAGLGARGAAVTEVPATALEVHQALAGGTYDGVHFSGHGTFRDANPDRSALLLERGDRFTPEAISGRLRNLGRSAPLVFLNACQVGRGAQSLVDVGGFARRFVGAGAAAFVGAYWSVYDDSASAFATALYDRLLAGETFGAAALHARQAVRDDGDPTWLAYTVYADPSARVVA
ncbi:MAG TPA: CHAT domain-containing protein [Longimicrobium sp.]|jgi:hypothetical protein